MDSASEESSGIIHLTDSVLNIVNQLHDRDIESSELNAFIEEMASSLLCLQELILNVEVAYSDQASPSSPTSPSSSGKQSFYNPLNSSIDKSAMFTFSVSSVVDPVFQDSLNHLAIAIESAVSQSETQHEEVLKELSEIERSFSGSDGKETPQKYIDSLRDQIGLYRKKIEEYKNVNEELKSLLDTLNDGASAAIHNDRETESNQLEERVLSLIRESNSLQAKLESADDALESSDSRVRVLTLENESLRDSLNGLEKQLDALLRDQTKEVLETKADSEESTIDAEKNESSFFNRNEPYRVNYLYEIKLLMEKVKQLECQLSIADRSKNKLVAEFAESVRRLERTVSQRDDALRDSMERERRFQQSLEERTQSLKVLRSESNERDKRVADMVRRNDNQTSKLSTERESWHSLQESLESSQFQLNRLSSDHEELSRNLQSVTIERNNFSNRLRKSESFVNASRMESEDYRMRCVRFEELARTLEKRMTALQQDLRSLQSEKEAIETVNATLRNRLSIAEDQALKDGKRWKSETEAAKLEHLREVQSMRIEIDRLESDLSHQRRESESDLLEWQRAEKLLKSEIALLQDQKCHLETLLRTSEDASVRASSVQSQTDYLNSHVELLEGKLKRMGSELLDEKEKHANELKSQNAELVELSSRSTSLVLELESVKGQIKDNENEIASMKRTADQDAQQYKNICASLRNDIHSLECTLLQTRATLSARDEEENRTKAILSRIREDNRILQLRLSSTSSDLQLLQSDHKSVSNRHQEAQTRIHKLETELQSLKLQLESSQDSVRSLTDSRDSVVSSLSDLQMASSSLSKDVETKSAEVAALRKSNDELERILGEEREFHSAQSSTLARSNSELESRRTALEESLRLAIQREERREIYIRELDDKLRTTRERSEGEKAALLLQLQDAATARRSIMEEQCSELNSLRESLKLLQGELESRDESIVALKLYLESSESTRILLEKSVNELQTCLSEEKSKSTAVHASLQGNALKQELLYQSQIQDLESRNHDLQKLCEDLQSQLTTNEIAWTSHSALLDERALGNNRELEIMKEKSASLAALCSSLTSRLGEREREVHGLISQDEEKARLMQTKELLLSKYKSRLELQEKQLERNARLIDELERALNENKRESRQVSSQRADSLEEKDETIRSLSRIQSCLETRVASIDRENSDLQRQFMDSEAALRSSREAGERLMKQKEELLSLQPSQVAELQSLKQSLSISSDKIKKLIQRVNQLDLSVASLGSELAQKKGDLHETEKRILLLETEVRMAHSEKEKITSQISEKIRLSESALETEQKHCRQLQLQVSLLEESNHSLEQFATTHLEATEADREEQKFRLECLDRQRSEAEQRFDDLKVAHCKELEKCTMLTTSLSEREKSLSAAQDEISSLGSVVESIKKLLQESHAREDLLQSRIQTLEATQKDLTASVESSGLEMTRLSQNANEWRDRFRQRDVEFTALKSQSDDLGAQLKALENQLSLDQVTLSSLEHERSEAVTTAQKISVQVLNFQRRLEAAEQKERTASDSAKEQSLDLASLRTQLQSEQCEQSSLKSLLSESRSSLARSLSELESCKHSLADVMTTKENATTALALLEREMPAQVSALGLLRTEYEALRGIAEDRSRCVVLLEQKLSAQEKLLEIKDQYLEDLRSQKESYRRQFQSALHSTRLPLMGTTAAASEAFLPGSDLERTLLSLNRRGDPQTLAGCTPPSSPSSPNSATSTGVPPSTHPSRSHGPEESRKGLPCHGATSNTRDSTIRLTSSRSRPEAPIARGIDVGVQASVGMRSQGTQSLGSYTYIPSYRDSHPELFGTGDHSIL